MCLYVWVWVFCICYKINCFLNIISLSCTNIPLTYTYLQTCLKTIWGSKLSHWIQKKSVCLIDIVCSLFVITSIVLFCIVWLTTPSKYNFVFKSIVSLYYAIQSKWYLKQFGAAIEPLNPNKNVYVCTKCVYAYKYWTTMQFS